MSQEFVWTELVVYFVPHLWTIVFSIEKAMVYTSDNAQFNLEAGV